MESERASERLAEELLSYLKPPVPVVDRDAESCVAAFYAGRSVFITGATGFIGKALIEKLVRSCAGLKRIYILVREKRGKGVQERVAELIKSQSFDRIRQMHDGSSRLLEEKIVAVRGDITQAKFGIAPEDMRVLSDECSIVFNSAATIRFAEPIENAARNNIYSVGQLVDFCDQLRRLEALVHLSTAYSNCHKRDTIHEIFYEPPMSGPQMFSALSALREIQAQIHVCPDLGGGGGGVRGGMINSSSSASITSIGSDDGVNPNASARIAADTTPNGAGMTRQRSACELQRFYRDNWRPDVGARAPPGRAERKTAAAAGYDLLEEFTRIALRRANRPNTYTLTKAISESYLLEKLRARPDRYLADKIPVAVVRPSIVVAAWREPLVGHIDNFNGATGVMASMYTGALQAMPCAGSRVADLVPIDMVANMVLCTGWFLASQAKEGARSPQANTTNELGARGTLHELVKPDKGVYLFNLVSGARNPFDWGRINIVLKEFSYKYPTKHLMRLPRSYIIRAGALYSCLDLLWQKAPAYLNDLIKSRLLGQQLEGRSSALWGYQRIRQMCDTLTPFTHNQWKFCDANTLGLYESLAPADRRLFAFDVAAIDWPQYILAYLTGVRIFMLNDEAKSLPEARAQLRRWRSANALLMVVLAALVYWLFLHETLAPNCLLGALGDGGVGADRPADQ